MTGAASRSGSCLFTVSARLAALRWLDHHPSLRDILGLESPVSNPLIGDQGRVERNLRRRVGDEDEPPIGQKYPLGLSLLNPDWSDQVLRLRELLKIDKIVAGLDDLPDLVERILDEHQRDESIELKAIVVGEAPVPSLQPPTPALLNDEEPSIDT